MAAWLTALALLVAAGASWGGVAWVVTSAPPANFVAMAAFYLFAFAGLATTSSLLGWMAARAGRNSAQGRLATPAGFLGHGMMLAGISLFGLWLQSLRMLTLTVALLLAGLYVFLELALLFGTRGSVDVPPPEPTHPYGAVS